MELKLNLGCADHHLGGWTNVDICPPADVIADLSKRWPWDDSSVSEVAAYDVIEHLPNRIMTMNELHRVLKPGGMATIVVPSASHGAGFAQDPTHVSQWTLNSFQYFAAGSYAVQRLATSYGITARFKVIAISESSYDDWMEPVWKITAVLQAVK